MAENSATRGVVNTASTNGDRNEEELMRELAAGRREALGPLHGRYASLVFGLGARSLDRATSPAARVPTAPVLLSTRTGTPRRLPR